MVLRAILFLLLAAVTTAHAQFTAARAKRHVQARLLLSHEQARPGDQVTAAVELTMAKGWHTYWRNPGDSGQETTIHWAAPTGVAPGEIQWPVPEKFTAEGLTTYVYHGTKLLLIPLTIATNAPQGTQTISALVEWLECEVSCVPGSNLVEATLTIGPDPKPSADSDAIKNAELMLPRKQAPGEVRARWDQPPAASARPLLIEWQAAARNPDFFPYSSSNATVSAKTDVLQSGPDIVALRKTVETNAGPWPDRIEGILVRDKEGAPEAFEVALQIEDGRSKKGDGGRGAGDGARKVREGSLVRWLAYAFLGGLILNIMPCVLPVIALKILGFVNQSREHPGRVRVLGLVYTLGVLTSFLVLAGIVIAIKAAGQRAGWGMQFSNPQFIVILTTIVTLVALNLFGVFEVTLSGRALTAASGAASRHGTAGAFMNGVLATLLATPCTAPFLGAALGFAFAQPAAVIVLFFAVIGLGLALPYLLLSWNPAWLRLLPKPGPWMDHFKVLMGFPLLATALWLFTLTISFYGQRVWWLGVFLVLVALAAWVFGTFVQRGSGRRAGAVVAVIVLLLGGYGFAIERQLQWRSPDEPGSSGALHATPGGIEWQRWTPEAVATARAQGRPVFVDFTADWCVTCQVNKRTSIEIPSVRAKLKQINAVALLGDYTRFPPAITAELEHYKRAGVPLVLVYPKDASRPAQVLPEVLTPGIVLEALDAAAK